MQLMIHLASMSVYTGFYLDNVKKKVILEMGQKHVKYINIFFKSVGKLFKSL